jgi:clan AA aspartic protease (TIGR02281 family)
MVVRKQRLNDQSRTLYSQLPPLEEQKRETLELIPRPRKKYKLAMQSIPVYHRELQNFSTRYSNYKQKLNLKTADADTQALFKKMDRYLAQFKKEVPTASIQSKQVGRLTIVQVLVNGTTTGEFIFDTGATTMTISESFAVQLKLALTTLPATEMIVADGRRVPVKSTRLRSVSVGGLEVKNVEVLVVPDSPNNLTDGLLGMSFLKHFAVGINGVTRKIELTRFMPNL